MLRTALILCCLLPSIAVAQNPDSLYFPKFRETFLNQRVAIGTSLAAGTPWKITDTSSAGSPTYTFVSPSATGEVKLTMAATSEVENICLDFGDVLCMDIDNIKRFEAVVKLSGMTTGTTVAFGLQSARNDDTDATTNNAQFKLIGNTTVVVETDDGTTDNNDVDSGETLSTTYKRFAIDFNEGTDDVRFFIDGVRVASTTTFDMSAATSSLQVFFQIQKTASTNVDAITIDDVTVELQR